MELHRLHALTFSFFFLLFCFLLFFFFLPQEFSTCEDTSFLVESWVGCRRRFRGESWIVDLAATFLTRSKVTTCKHGVAATCVAYKRALQRKFISPRGLLLLFFTLSTRILRCNVASWLHGDACRCVARRSVTLTHLILPRRFLWNFFFSNFIRFFSAIRYTTIKVLRLLEFTETQLRVWIV